MTINEKLNIPALKLLDGCFVVQGPDGLLYKLFTGCKQLENGQLVKISRFLRIAVPENRTEVFIPITNCEVNDGEHYIAQNIINELTRKNMLLQRIVTFYNKLSKMN